MSSHCRIDSSMPRRGFTMLEILIVLAIIAILAIVLYPMTSDYLKRGRDADRKNDLNRVALTLNSFFIEYRVYPGATDGCLVRDTFTRLDSSYSTPVPISPSGSEYDE